MPMVAWYVLSNESYMNRVMRDVLPTATIASVSTVSMSFPVYCIRHTALFAQKHEPE